MKLEVKDNCPLNGFEKCKQFECAWFIELKGKNPQTGEDVNDWGCSMAVLPLLLVENARQSYHTGAAVESLRNKVVEQTKEVYEIAARNGNLVIGP